VVAEGLDTALAFARDVNEARACCARPLLLALVLALVSAPHCACFASACAHARLAASPAACHAAHTPGRVAKTAQGAPASLARPTHASPLSLAATLRVDSAPRSWRWISSLARTFSCSPRDQTAPSRCPTTRPTCRFVQRRVRVVCASCARAPAAAAASVADRLADCAPASHRRWKRATHSSAATSACAPRTTSCRTPKTWT
jgi:hypothetical protein